MWGWVVFLDKYRKPIRFHTQFSDLGCVELTLRDGRKNDATSSNPPIILAADQLSESQRFNACFQVYRAINFMNPSHQQLEWIPLLPMRLYRQVPASANAAWFKRNFTSFVDTELTKAVRR